VYSDLSETGRRAEIRSDDIGGAPAAPVRGNAGDPIVTTTPNELCAEIHNRMPVILPPETWPIWLGEEPAETDQLKALLAPYPAEGMTMWPVSTRVGNVKNNDPSLIKPVAV
jgi:putative SOS response-associated peptidase YedK